MDDCNHTSKALSMLRELNIDHEHSELGTGNALSAPSSARNKDTDRTRFPQTQDKMGKGKGKASDGTPLSASSNAPSYKLQSDVGPSNLNQHSNNQTTNAQDPPQHKYEAFARFIARESAAHESASHTGPSKLSLIIDFGNHTPTDEENEALDKILKNELHHGFPAPQSNIGYGPGYTMDFPTSDLSPAGLPSFLTSEAFSAHMSSSSFQSTGGHNGPSGNHGLTTGTSASTPDGNDDVWKEIFKPSFSHSQRSRSMNGKTGAFIDRRRDVSSFAMERVDRFSVDGLILLANRRRVQEARRHARQPQPAPPTNVWKDAALRSAREELFIPTVPDPECDDFAEFAKKIKGQK